MFDNKFLISLIGVSIAIYAISSILKSSEAQEIKEGFLSGPSMKVKLERSIGNNRGVDFYSIPQFQSMLSPRFSNTDYGANIQYNLPDYKNLATPCNPLMMGDMVSSCEGFKMKPGYNSGYTDTGSSSASRGLPTPRIRTQLSAPKNKNPGKSVERYQDNNSDCVGCGPTQCGKGGSNLNSFDTNFAGPSNYASGNFNEVSEQVYSDTSYPEANAMFPVGDMKTVNGLGEVNQAVIYDRYIYANRNSRLRSLGDPIRGDLAIVPCSGNWFTPSVQPNIDLQEGALNVMGGFDGEQQRKLSDLIYASSGGADTAIGGINLANQYNSNLCAGGNDIITTAYP